MRTFREIFRHLPERVDRTLLTDLELDDLRFVLDRLPVFDRLTPDGVAWDDGRSVRADAVLWATGFRAALGHLAPLGLRGPGGGIRMEGTHVAGEPRVHLVGYGPSASTVGANRAGREAAVALRRLLHPAAALPRSAWRPHGEIGDLAAQRMGPRRGSVQGVPGRP